MLGINLAHLPPGKSYEDRYQGYMDIFKRIATNHTEKVSVKFPPWSWVPLLRYMNCSVGDPRPVFKHCPVVRDAIAHTILDRTLVEVLCGFRPECVDALWKFDCEWQPQGLRKPQLDDEQEFIVTNNGSFFRHEVQVYMARLSMYIPEKRKVVLVPCAADKPYPSSMHSKVLSMLPNDWYLMNATGVLGLVPQDLWSCMPWYDSGIPNRWRVQTTAFSYFKKFPHDKIVVFGDFYNQALEIAFQLLGIMDQVTFVNEVKFYYNYIDLLDPERLKKLEEALQ